MLLRRGPVDAGRLDEMYDNSIDDFNAHLFIHAFLFVHRIHCFRMSDVTRITVKREV